MDILRRDILEKGKLRIGLDIDDTITRCPAFFALLCKALLDAGHEVHVISYRESRQQTEEELREYGIRFTSLTLTDRDDFAREGFFQWKAKVCKELGIDILFEDMPEVINQLDGSTIAFVAFDPELGRLEYQQEQSPPDPTFE